MDGALVAQGSGITLLPELAVVTEAQRSELSIRHFAAPVPGRTIALIWRKHSPLSVSLRSFAALIRAAYPGTAAAKPDTGKRVSRRAKA